MAVHQRRLKTVTFSLDSEEFQCQLVSWTMQNDSDDGEQVFTMCPDGEFREEVDPAYSLELTFVSDWRLDGISDFLWAHDGETVGFILSHHEGFVGEHVQWAGNVVIKAPNVGGERGTEMTEVTLQCIGKPAYTRPA